MDIKQIVDNVMEQIAPMTNRETYAIIRKFLMENGEEMAQKIIAALPKEEEMNRRIDEVMAKNAKDLPLNQQMAMRLVLHKMYIEGQSYGEAIGMSQEDFDTLYNLAYNLYNSGKYKDALVFFSYLTLLNRSEGLYFFGTAASYHMLKDYESAVQFYQRCANLDFLNPMPWFHLADCYNELGLPQDAAAALEEVIVRTRNNKVYNTMYEKAQLLLKSTLEKGKLAKQRI